MEFSFCRLCLCHTASRGVILALREGARLEIHNAHLSSIPALQARAAHPIALALPVLRNVYFLYEACVIAELLYYTDEGIDSVYPIVCSDGEVFQQ